MTSNKASESGPVEWVFPRVLERDFWLGKDFRLPSRIPILAQPLRNQATLAQLVEHRYRKPRVTGSNPVGGSI